jgi:hypothetical protein
MIADGFRYRSTDPTLLELSVRMMGRAQRNPSLLPDQMLFRCCQSARRDPLYCDAIRTIAERRPARLNDGFRLRSTHPTHLIFVRQRWRAAISPIASRAGSPPFCGGELAGYAGACLRAALGADPMG